MYSSRPLYDVLSSLPVPAFPASVLSWSPGSSPVSSLAEVVAVITTYLVVCFGGQWLMQDRKAFKFQYLFMLHNALLSFGSALLLAVMLEEIIPIVYNHGFFHGICHTAAWTTRLETFYIINYYFKCWELLDTLFLVVKKKPLQLLHTYHHPATLALCYFQLQGRTSVSWVPITLNLGVHVLMYYYYFATSAGYKIWWKKYLTSLQITQFVIDLGVVYFAAYSYFASSYFPKLPVMGSCSGTEDAAIIGCVILSSYLFLFVAFFRKTYKQPVKPKAASKAIAEFKKRD